MLKSLLLCSGSTWQIGRSRSIGIGGRQLLQITHHGRYWEGRFMRGHKSYGFLLKVYRNNPSLEKVSLSSSSISSTTNFFFAFFMNCMSALLRFLKQKYMTASLHNSRRSTSVLRSNGKAGSKYTQSAAKMILGFSLRSSAGNGSPLSSLGKISLSLERHTSSGRAPSHVPLVHLEQCSFP